MKHPLSPPGRDAWRAYVLFLVAFFALPNLLVRGTAFAITGHRAPLNLDYLIVGALAAFLARGARSAVVVGAFAAALLLDVVVTGAPLFHFELAQVGSAILTVISSRAWTVLAAAAILGGAAVGAAWLATRMVRAPRSTWRALPLALVATAACFWLVDAVNGTGLALRSGRARLGWNLAASGGFSLASAILTDIREQGRRGEMMIVEVPAATDGLRAALQASDVPSRNIVLVLVESLGRFRDHAVNDALLAPLTDDSIRARYDVRVGDAPFQGATTAGEFRELCGQRRTYIVAPTSPLGICLAEQLRERGFRTLAVHGFRPRVFDRERWYPVVGFDRVMFRADIPPADRDCGTIFIGACDADAAAVVHRELLSAPRERQFVYWLTLNSHVPVDVASATDSSMSCSRGVLREADRTVCLLAWIWHGTLRSVREIALDDRLGPTRFIVVGDHSPPLVRARDVRLFRDDVVPYVELVPRGAASWRAAVAAGSIGGGALPVTRP